MRPGDRVVAGNLAPDHSTIAEFRCRHERPLVLLRDHGVTADRIRAANARGFFERGVHVAERRRQEHDFDGDAVAHQVGPNDPRHAENIEWPALELKKVFQSQIDHTDIRIEAAIAAQELADMKEDLDALNARWEAEKAGLNRVGDLKERIDNLRSQAEMAQRQGDLGEAAVRGFQGDNLSDPLRVLACAKHFAGDGGTLIDACAMQQGFSVVDLMASPQGSGGDAA